MLSVDESRSDPSTGVSIELRCAGAALNGPALIGPTERSLVAVCLEGRIGLKVSVIIGECADTADICGRRHGAHLSAGGGTLERWSGRGSCYVVSGTTVWRELLTAIKNGRMCHPFLSKTFQRILENQLQGLKRREPPVFLILRAIFLAR